MASSGINNDGVFYMGDIDTRYNDERCIGGLGIRRRVTGYEKNFAEFHDQNPLISTMYEQSLFNTNHLDSIVHGQLMTDVHDTNDYLYDSSAFGFYSFERYFKHRYQYGGAPETSVNNIVFYRNQVPVASLAAQGIHWRDNVAASTKFAICTNEANTQTAIDTIKNDFNNNAPDSLGSFKIVLKIKASNFEILQAYFCFCLPYAFGQVDSCPYRVPIISYSSSPYWPITKYYMHYKGLNGYGNSVNVSLNTLIN